MNIASLYLAGFIDESTEKYWWVINELEKNTSLLESKHKQLYEAGLDFLVAFRSFLEKDFESFIEYTQKYLKRDPHGVFFTDFGIERDGYQPLWDIYLTCESENLYDVNETLQMLLDMWRQTKNKLFFAHLSLDYCALLYEQNRMEEAQQQAQKALDMGKDCDNLNLVVKASLMLAQIANCRNEYYKTDQIIHELLLVVDEKRHARLIKEIKLFQIRCLLQDEALHALTKWVNDNGFSVADEISPSMIEEYELFARILMLQDKRTEAMHLLNRLKYLAQQEGKHRYYIRFTLLQCLLLEKEKQTFECFQMLEDVLATALPNGFVRVFLDEGSQLEELLKRYIQGVRNHYVKRSRHVDLERVKRLVEWMMIENFSRKGNAEEEHENLSEHLLTNKQHKVLQLMHRGLSNKEIAEELDVSLSTVKTHINHLYQKLEVNNRLTAIKKARQLNLLND